MIISWYGISCFLIETSSKLKILMDPYDFSLGGKPYEGHADIITISHNHIGHNFINHINSDAEIIRTTGEHKLGPITITGYPSFHDSFKGSKRGVNIIYVLEADGLRLCHLGDLGHLLSPHECDILSEMDILFVPVNKNFSLSADDAFLTVKQLAPKIVIPMNYYSFGISFPSGGIEKFITLVKKATALNSNTLEVTSPVSESHAVTILKAT